MEIFHIYMSFFHFYIDGSAEIVYNEAEVIEMEHNICKFNETSSGDLLCTKFVYETSKAQAGGELCDKYALGFVVKGEGTLTWGAQVHPLSQGCVFFIPRNTSYRIDGEGELCYLYLHFHGRRADELSQRVGVCDEPAVFDKTEHYARIVDFGFDCLRKASAENLDIFSEAALLYILGHLESERRADGGVLAAIVASTNDRFSESSFSLSALAGELGYDAKYLSTLFKKKKGIPFTRYLRELRIRHALFLMEQGVVSVKNIAILCGFGDALYFSKIFKEEMGISPKAHIEKLNEK